MTIITISGLPGSGTTTLAKLLEEKLGLKYVYSGDIFRKMAQEHNMTLEEFGRYCEQSKEIDEKLDKYQLEILKKGNVIIEGRITGWIAHRNNIKSLKVLIEADVETRARRIVKRENGDVAERKKEMLTREKSEFTRYRNYYNIDLKDVSIYDLVIDSSDKTPEEIAEIVIREIRK